MDPTSLAFLFLDEAMDEHLDLVALIGVLVDQQKYRDVRDAMCKLVWDITEPPPNTVTMPVELHGSRLLSELNELPAEELDRKRVDVFRRCVEIVNAHELSLIRNCYLNRSEISDLLRRHDPALYSLNFHGVMSLIHAHMENNLVIPVMDGIPGSSSAKKAPRINPVLIRAFAETARSLHHARQLDVIKDCLTIPNAHNLVEPVFADSAHSVMLQLADLISYLLLQRDRHELETPVNLTPFKEMVLEEARRIRPERITESRGRMRITR
jgi:hypothetical protein